MTSRASLPPAARPIVEAYVAEVAQKLPDLYQGFYLIGSIALDAYDKRLSDIDFVAVLTRQPTTAELETIGDIHKDIAQQYPASKLSGSYYQMADLGRAAGEFEPRPYYHDGAWHPHGHTEVDMVTWWVLKNRALVLLGPDPQELPFTVSWEKLLTEMKGNLNSYWAGWGKRPDGLLMLLTEWGIAWVVLGVLRQFYTFRENSIVSKMEAGLYGLQQLPPRWHKLIGEAVRIRQGEKPSAYRSRLFRARETTHFLREIIRICNEEG